MNAVPWWLRQRSKPPRAKLTHSAYCAQQRFTLRCGGLDQRLLRLGRACRMRTFLACRSISSRSN